MKIDIKLDDEKIKFQLSHLQKEELIDIVLEYIDFHRSLRGMILTDEERKMEAPTTKQVADARYYQENKDRKRLNFIRRRIVKGEPLTEAQKEDIERLSKQFGIPVEEIYRTNK